MLFSLSGVELRFTRGALRAVGEATQPMGTGARGLRKVMEGVLEEGMYEAPGTFTVPFPSLPRPCFLGVFFGLFYGWILIKIHVKEKVGSCPHSNYDR